MYKTSGKKYKGSSKGASATGQQQQQQYRNSEVYNSDVYSDDDVDSLYDDGINSPDYYSGTASGKNGFFTHQSSASNNKQGSNMNYYGAAKSNDRFYSATPGYNTSTRNNQQFNSSYSKHKGKDVAAYKLNKYQTIVLKVQIHCDACIKKVKKAIAKIDGVESITVDHKLKRVSVTGYIDPKKVLKKVAKTGKCVELIGGSLGPKEIHHQSASSIPHQFLSNKLALMATPEHHHQIHHPAIASTMKPYTVQVEKSSRSNNVHHNNANMPHYSMPLQAPQLRSDMDYIFSDDNAHSCSIM